MRAESSRRQRLRTEQVASTEVRWRCEGCGGENPAGTRFCGHCGQRRAEEPDADEAPAASATAGRERRLVTALFADISGFTSLSERLDPEALTEIIDPILAALGDVVGRYDGFINKYAGDALLALFGAPIAHEDDATRAALAALEMHEVMGRVTPSLGPDAAALTLHIGINTGHAVARPFGSEQRIDYSVLGDAVNTAQRFEASAGPGETLVGDLTYRLTSEELLYEPAGALTLKGKAEDVPAWRLLGRRDDAASSEGTAAAAPRPIVGRARELAIVAEAIGDLVAGDGGVLSLVAEPGGGKSLLLAEAEARYGADACWLDARCLTYGRDIAYWPYAELLRRWCGVRADDPGAGARLVDALRPLDLAEHAPFLGRLAGVDLGTLGDDPAEELEPEAVRRAMHGAVAAWLEALARKQPVVLAIEDLHWIDPSSLALTVDAMTASRNAAILLVVTGRPEATDAIGALVEAIGPPRSRRVELGKLDDAAVRELLAALLGKDAPPELAEAVIDRAGGNAFFVEELVQSLRDADRLVPDGDGWVLSGPLDLSTLPPTIEGLLSARIDQLDLEEALVLQAAAVIGRQVDAALVASVAQVDHLDAILGRLVERGLLEMHRQGGDGDGLRFRHALVAQAAYDRILRRQRRRLHLAVADAAERLFGDRDDTIDLTARHLYLGEAGMRAVVALARAGRRAAGLFANEEAIGHLEHAVEAGGDLDEAREVLPALLVDLGDLYELLGEYESALERYHAALARAAALSAWCGVATVHRKRGDQASALAALDEAFASGPLGSEEQAQLWLERGRLHLYRFAFEAAKADFERGLAVAAPGGVLAGRLLMQLARTEAGLGAPELALARGEAAAEVLERHGDQRNRATALRVIGMAHFDLGHLDDAAASVSQSIELARRTGNVEEEAGCLVTLGLIEKERGRIDEAIDCDRRAIAHFERTGHDPGRALCYANLADKLVHAGRYVEAERWCQEAATVAGTLDDVATIAEVTLTRAEIRAHESRFQEAAELGEQAADLALTAEAGATAASALRLVADARRALGDSAGADSAAARAADLEREAPGEG